MRIGVPKEIKTLEFRIGATPGVVQRLVPRGPRSVRRGRGAGAGIGLADQAYADVGAAHSARMRTRCSRPPR